MKRHHWFLVIGLCFGLLLGGVKCSLNVSQTPSATPGCGDGVSTNDKEN